MNNSTKIAIGIAGLVIVVAAIGAYFYFSAPQVPAPSTTATATTTGTQTVDLGNGNAIQMTGGGTIKIEPTGGTLPPAPNASRTITYPANYTAEMKAATGASIAGLVTMLKKDSTNVAAWIDLGTYYKQVGDYEGAKIMWQYASAIAPNDTLSLNNLGNLEQYFLKDYAASEKFYLQALKLDTKNAGTYQNLFDLYHLSYLTATTKAADIAKQGIAATGDGNLMIALARYYKEKGDVANAKIYYAQAVAKAKSINNAGLAASLQAESDALK